MVSPGGGISPPPHQEPGPLDQQPKLLDMESQIWFSLRSEWMTRYSTRSFAHWEGFPRKLPFSPQPSPPLGGRQSTRSPRGLRLIHLAKLSRNHAQAFPPPSPDLRGPPHKTGVVTWMQHWWMAWGLGSLCMWHSYALCLDPIPDIALHFLMYHCWAGLILQLGGSNRSQLMMGVYNHVVTWYPWSGTVSLPGAPF